MTLNTNSAPPVSPGAAAAPPAVLPGTADAAFPEPPHALLTSGQLMAALRVSRRMLKNWNRHRVIPSVGRGRARRYDMALVMAALEAHGQPAPAASSAAPPGIGGAVGMASDGEYHVLPR